MKPITIIPSDYGITSNHKEIIINNNLFANFDHIIKKLSLGKKHLIVTDQTIYHKVITLFPNIESDPNMLILEKNSTQRIKATLSLAQQIQHILKDYDYAIAIGSGTINDLVKYASYQANKPYIIFATSPSMNGYLSANSSLISDNTKKSYKANSPIAAYFDLQTLSNSPIRLIKSGLGDSLCTHTIRADWLLSHYLLNTKYSDFPFELTRDLEKKLLSNITALNKRAPEIISILTQILILSGLAMLETGNSCSASQGEHLIAHLYEILDPENSHKSFHGEQIAFTCLYMTKLQEKFLHNTTPQLPKKHISIEDFAFLPKHLQEHHYQQFLTTHITASNTTLTRIWPNLKARILEHYISSTELQKILTHAQLPNNITELKWQEHHFETASKNAHLTRNRFTFLSLKLNHVREAAS